ncbi:MAG: Gfo/Idh/MocA family oxidoreductase [Dehalococcoidia bacterium]
MSDSHHIRVGIIGFGLWAINAYLPAIVKNRGIEVAAAAGRSESTQNAARALLGQNALITSDFQKLLDPGVVDAVMIAVTEDQHAVTIGAALDSGLPVFYEPPLSNRRDQLHVEIERLTSARQITHADLELSYLPIVDHAATLISTGAIGMPHGASVTMTSGWGPVPGSDVSLACQLIPWYLDPLNRVLGQTPKRVLVQDGAGVAGRMQSQTLVQLDYEGVWGTFDANIQSVGELGAHITVHGSDGDLEADLFRGELRTRSRQNPDWRSESRPAEQPHAGWPGMHESIAAFIAGIGTGDETRSGSATAVDLQLTGLAAEASIDSGTWADVARLQS